MFYRKIMNRKLIAAACLPVLFYCCSPGNDSDAVKNKKDSDSIAIVKTLPAKITFSEHVAPVIFTNCSPCHRPDGVAPFQLLTYQDVKKKAKTIRYVVSNRIMPPWPADPSYTHFIGEKVLPKESIALLCRWIDLGCPQGDSLKMPARPGFPKGSMLGKPDLVVKMQKTVRIKGNNRDMFLLMKLPYEIGKDTFLRAIEFVPNNKKTVHHVNGFLLQYDEQKPHDLFGGDFYADAEQTDFKTAYQQMHLAYADGTYPMLTPSAVNYLPGVLPYFYPEGVGGLRVKSHGAVFLKDIHYGPSVKDGEDSSYFNFFFMPHPPKRPLKELQLGTWGSAPIVPPLVIPPDSVKKFTTRQKINEDISIVTINPHMHLLGKTFTGFAIKPNGDTIPLIHIPQWDFRWQYFYTFPKMVKIPAGSTIVAIGVFDNTVNNPRNPNHPPKTVSEREGSMRTTDEMFQFIINYLPYKTGDENISLEPGAKKQMFNPSGE
ncbi:MAG: calcium-binding EF-hand-containing protein [Bacteroidetes bacterium]|nr:MAG: calcium-binding EF-hand-containing protein [Bacteroidota bacterium]